MLDYKQMKADYISSVQEYEVKGEKYRRLQEKYKRLESKLKYPHWMEHYLTPIAEELITHFPESRFEVSGPFGLCCETSISIHNKNNLLLAFLQFVLGSNHEIMLRDYLVDNGEFSHGTIGEMNGMNHPNISIPDENTIEWFLDKIKYFGSTISEWDSAKPKAETRA